MKNEMKMCISDFENTLIDSEEAIPMTTVLAIDAFRNSGNKFVIATENVLSYVLSYNQDFNFLDYIIACNGACIYDVALEKVIWKRPLEQNIIRNIKQSFEDASFIHFYTRDRYFLYASTMYQKKNHKVIQSDIKDFNRFFAKYRKKIYKIVLYFPTVKQKNIASRELKQLNLDISSIEEGNKIEILTLNVGKESAMEYLANREEIVKENLFAIGDSVSDIKMIKKAGCGVAVANASKSVQKVAKEITDSNDQCGVEKFLKKINDLH